jgi:hypothetical protein
VDCPAGTHANSDEDIVTNQCRKCPDLSYSTEKSKFCPFCAKGHYMDLLANDATNSTLIEWNSMTTARNIQPEHYVINPTRIFKISQSKKVFGESLIILQAFTNADMKTYATVLIIRILSSIAQSIIAQLTILAFYARFVQRVGTTSVKMMASASYAHHLEVFLSKFF